MSPGNFQLLNINQFIKVFYSRVWKLSIVLNRRQLSSYAEYAALEMEHLNINHIAYCHSTWKKANPINFPTAQQINLHLRFLKKPVNKLCQEHFVDYNFLVKSILEGTQAYAENKWISPFDTILAGTNGKSQLNRKIRENSAINSLEAQPAASAFKAEKQISNFAKRTRNSFEPSENEDDLDMKNFFLNREPNSFSNTQNKRILRNTQSLPKNSLNASQSFMRNFKGSLEDEFFLLH